MFILIDHPDRENEGDLIFPAELITPETMNFIIRNTSGIVCLSILEDQLKKLDLPFMVQPIENSSAHGTPFTISIDAKHGITTGVSASDRSKTIQDAIKNGAKAADLAKPGHIFPLQAKAGGVLERGGHTEGAVDIVRLAGFKPAAVLCEIMNEDGSMTRGVQMDEFAKKHQLHILSIEDIINYRLSHENLIEEVFAELPLEGYGSFKMTVIKEKINKAEHISLTKGKINNELPTLVRIHSACITGDLFGSQKCDCNKQLHYSLKCIDEKGGILIYLDQEGRGIGFLNKIKAYSLQEKGFDTVDANLELGLPIDSRRYHVAANILRNLNIHSIKLLTNNPAKISDLKYFGINNVEIEKMPVFYNAHNETYLKTKKEKLNHQFDN